MDPRVRRFIELRGDDVRSVRDDVAPYLGMTLEEKAPHVEAALRGLGTFLRANPERREQILASEDRLSRESEALWRRLIAEARRARGQ